MKKIAALAGVAGILIIGWFVIIPNFMQGTGVWCTYMDTVDKADWGIADAAEYTKSCTFRD